MNLTECEESQEIGTACHPKMIYSVYIVQLFVTTPISVSKECLKLLETNAYGYMKL